MDKKNFDIKELLTKIVSFVKQYSKALIPFALGVLSCLIVVLALNLRNKLGTKEPAADPGPETTVEEPQEEVIPLSERVIPLEENKDKALESVILKYYECLSNGDMEMFASLCDYAEEKKLLIREEQAKYLEDTVTAIYTQPGPVDASYIVWVCYDCVFDAYPENALPGYDQYYVRADESGEYMIINVDRSKEEEEYISYATSQEDVIELHNRVTVDYNDKVSEHPELLVYMEELTQLVNEAVGERIAAMNATEETPEEPAEGEGETGETGTGEGETQAPAEPQIIYVTATAKVNVRKSDSENADKLGQVQAGTKLQVVEQQVNGWTKVLYDGKEGFIKSQFLSVVEDASSLPVLGTVTTNDAVNARTQPNQESERLGVVPQGETLDLLGEEGEWVKVKYNGQVAYIKAEFVTVKKN